MKFCLNDKCKKALEADAIVFAREDKSGAVCSMACGAVFDKKNEKQTELVPRWVKKRVIARIVRVTECDIPKVNTTFKDGKKFPQLTVNLPGSASVDALGAFSGQPVEIEISRTYFKNEPLTTAEKAAKKKADDKAKTQAKEKAEATDKLKKNNEENATPAK